MALENALNEVPAPEFAVGAIRRLEMKNFMTYESAVMEAGPQLNLIIAMNGAGKSTTLMALALALGGQPNILGRASNIAGFIRHGQTKAVIKVTLHDPELADPTVVREIELVSLPAASSRRAKGVSYTEAASSDAEDDEGSGNGVRSGLKKPKAKSNWRLNGKVSNETAVREFLKVRYNTQVGNLCQVLPQEKVSMFSRLNDIDLLTETIRAGLGQSYIDEQQNIAEEQLNLSKAATSVRSAAEELEHKQHEMESIKGQVARLQEREAWLAEAQMLEKRLIHIDIISLKRESEVLRNNLKNLSYQEREAAENLKAAKAKLAQHEQEVKSIREPHESREAIHRSKLAVSAANQKNAKAFDVIDAALDSVKDELQRIHAYKERVSKAEMKLAQEEATMAEWVKDTDKDTLTARLHEISELSNKYQLDWRNLARQVKDIDIAMRTKSEMEKSHLRTRDTLLSHLSAKESVLNKVNNQFIKRAWSVVKGRMESGSSHGKTYIPVMELKTASSVVASFIERCVGINKLLTLVTDSSKEASEALYPLPKVDVFCVNSIQEPRRRLNKLDLSKFSLLGYLDELIQGPPEVIQALRDIAGIHKCIVGTEETVAAFLELSSEDQVKYFEGLQIHTPDTMFSVQRSKYGKKESFVVTKEYSRGLPAAIYICGTEDENIKRRLHQAEQHLHEVRSELQALNDQRSSLTTMRGEADALLYPLHSERNKITALLEFGRKQKIKTEALKSEYARLIKNTPEQASVQGILRRISGSMKDMAMEVQSNKIAERFELAMPALNDIVLFNVRRAKIRLSLAEYNAKVFTTQSSLQSVHNQISHARQDRDSNRNKRRLLLENLGEVSEKEDQALRKLPEDKETVRAQIASFKSKADSVLPDENVKITFDRLTKEIVSLEEHISNSNDANEDKNSSLQARYNRWTNEVESLLDLVDKNFRACFELVEKQGYNCAGTVRAEINTSDILKCGVAISVRFRANQDLRRLDVHIQSGGERSLTTFLYLLALNKVSRVPFRIVDEINQGMDEEKERISMQHLFSTSCSDNASSQYFLITPKLLSGLIYPPTATIHVVFNGHGALPQREARFSHFVKAGSILRPNSSSSSSVASLSQCLQDRTNTTDDDSNSDTSRKRNKSSLRHSQVAPPEKRRREIISELA